MVNKKLKSTFRAIRLTENERAAALRALRQFIEDADQEWYAGQDESFDLRRAIQELDNAEAPFVKRKAP